MKKTQAWMMILLIVTLPFTISLSSSSASAAPQKNDLGKQCEEKSTAGQGFIDFMDSGAVKALEAASALLFTVSALVNTIDTVLDALSLIWGHSECCWSVIGLLGPCEGFEAAWKAWSAIKNAGGVLTTVNALASCACCSKDAPQGDLCGFAGSNVATSAFGVEVDAFDSIYTAVGCMCPVAVLFNLRKLKTIYQVNQCCVEQACKSGESIEACERQLDEATCMYWEGGAIKAVLSVVIRMVSSYLAKIVSDALVGTSLDISASCVRIVYHATQIPGRIQAVMAAKHWLDESFSDPNCGELGFEDVKKRLELGDFTEAGAIDAMTREIAQNLREPVTDPKAAIGSGIRVLSYSEVDRLAGSDPRTAKLLSDNHLERTNADGHTYKNRAGEGFFFTSDGNVFVPAETTQQDGNTVETTAAGIYLPSGGVRQLTQTETQDYLQARSDFLRPRASYSYDTAFLAPTSGPLMSADSYSFGEVSGKTLLNIQNSGGETQHFIWDESTDSYEQRNEDGSTPTIRIIIDGADAQAIHEQELQRGQTIDAAAQADKDLADYRERHKTGLAEELKKNREENARIDARLSEADAQLAARLERLGLREPERWEFVDAQTVRHGGYTYTKKESWGSTDPLAPPLDLARAQSPATGEDSLIMDGYTYTRHVTWEPPAARNGYAAMEQVQAAQASGTVSADGIVTDTMGTTFTQKEAWRDPVFGLPLSDEEVAVLLADGTRYDENTIELYGLPYIRTVDWVYQEKSAPQLQDYEQEDLTTITDDTEIQDLLERRAELEREKQEIPRERYQENKKQLQGAFYEITFYLLNSLLGQYAYAQVDKMCKEDWEASEVKKRPSRTNDPGASPAPETELSAECLSVVASISALPFITQIIPTLQEDGQYKIEYSIRDCRLDSGPAAFAIITRDSNLAEEELYSGTTAGYPDVREDDPVTVVPPGSQLCVKIFSVRNCLAEIP